MRINAAVSASTVYQQMATTGSDSRSLEKLESGGSTNRSAATDEAAALQLRSTQTIQGFDNPSAVVRISPQAMALSHNADAATGFNNALVSLTSQATDSTPSTAAASSTELARRPIQGLSDQRASAEPASAPPAAVSNTATVARADGATSLAPRSSTAASEVASQTRAQLLNQTGQAQLAQANAVPSHVLSLLL